jgi:16S rRNA (guanine1207-N2)-methyltransferase
VRRSSQPPGAGRGSPTRKWRERHLQSFSVEVGERRLTFSSQPGVFSSDGLDEGTSLLLDVVMPMVKPHMTVLDLGAGVGVLGIVLATKLERGEVWMVDVDIRAIRLAEENVRRNGIDNARIVLGDTTLDLPSKQRFDLVVSNPPTHSGREVLASFVGESWEVLRPGGSLYLVVNRLLSVRQTMEEVFGSSELIERRKGFIVFRATKPRREAGTGR